MPRAEQGGPADLIAAGLFLGIGLGGFIDGIGLHQILQWHNMLSSRIPPVTLVAMKYNMIWDGLFHALTCTMTVIGVALLFRAGRRAAPWSGRVLLGAMLAGWGSVQRRRGRDRSRAAKDYDVRANTVAAGQPAHPDVFARFAAETSALCTATLVPGDFLYLPSRWWHMALCREDALSISVGVALDSRFEARAAR